MGLLTFCATALFVILGSASLDFLSQSSQRLCQFVAREGVFGPWKSALICGTRLDPAMISYEVRAFGLIHLIVVSGAHLVFLENMILRPLFFFVSPKAKQIGISSCIIIYCFMAGLQAPLVRALFQRISFKFQSQSIFTAGVLTALFFREVSLSLVLSWSCALLISWPSLREAHPLTRSLIILIGLYPLLLPLGAPATPSALFQPFFSLIFGAFIFPLTFLGLLLPISESVDCLWGLFFQIIEYAGKLDFTLKISQLPWLSKELYVLLLQILYWRAEVSVSRAKIWGAGK